VPVHASMVETSDMLHCIDNSSPTVPQSQVQQNMEEDIVEASKVAIRMSEVRRVVMKIGAKGMFAGHSTVLSPSDA
jgi:hypothetical protein